MIIIPSNVAAAIPSDPSWANVTLSLKDIGINGATNSSFRDDGPFNFLPTRNGDTTQGTFSPFGALTGTADATAVGGSVWFDGAGDYLSLASNSAFDFGTGDFCVEGWINPTAVTGADRVLWDTRAGAADAGMALFIDTNGKLSTYTSNALRITSTDSVVPNAWQHIALVRSSGTLTFYINGKQSGTLAYSTAITNPGSVWLGIRFDVAAAFTGYMSNWRVVKGTAVYTPLARAATQPNIVTTGLVAYFDGNNTGSYSGTGSTWTNLVSGGSAYNATISGAVFDTSESGHFTFSGSNSVSIPSPVQDNMTLSCWFKTTSSSGSATQWYTGAALLSGEVGGIANDFGLGIGAGKVMFGTGSSDVSAVSPLTYNDGRWHYAAGVRTRSTGLLQLYVDGALVATATGQTGALSATTTIYMGRHPGEANGLVGNVAAALIYNSALTAEQVVANFSAFRSRFEGFTPSTSPLTAITGTSLLTCQSATSITDVSSNAFSINRFGDVRANPATPFGQGSVYFDGAGDYITIPSSTAVAYGTADFTVEFWAYPTSNAGSLFISGYNGTAVAGVNVGITNATSLWWLFGNGSSWDFERRPTYTLSMNTWHHFAVTRESGTAKLYVDGALVDSVANTTNFGSSAWYVGAAAAAGYSMAGYVSNVRTVKGTAVYTAAFTPPTAPLTAISGTSLLTCQDKGRIVDASSNGFAFARAGDVKPVGETPFAQTTSWSTYFDGNDYMYVLGNNAISNFGTANFTIEFWIMPTTAGQDNCLVDFRPGATNGAYPLIGLTGGALQFVTQGVTQISGPTVPVGVWSHVAVTRSGTSTKMWLNGVQAGSTLSDSTSYGCGLNRPLVSGNGYTNGDRSWFTGYMSNLRLVNGTAVYTSAFTPPGSPLTAIAGTGLLTLQDNYLVDRSSYKLSIGKDSSDLPVSRLSPFGSYGVVATTNLASAGSVYLDGSGDLLTLPTNSAFAFGTGDFTIEAWISPNGSSSYQTLLSTRASDNSSTGVFFGLNTGTLNPALIGSSGVVVASSIPVVANSWNHVALVRNSGTVTVYVNGVSGGSASSSTNFTDTTCNVGNILSTSGAWYAGYISNVRVIKGTALYTGNFTPSTSPLTAISGTSLLTAQDAVTVTDTSSNAFTITKVGDAKAVEASPFKRVTYPYGGSVYFDGTGDYLLIPDNPALRLGAGDFTVEAWVYPTAVTNTYTSVIFGTHSYSGSYGDRGWCMGLSPAGKAVMSVLGSSGTPEVVTESGTRLTTQWVHLAAVRRGTTLTLYVNGVNSGSITSTINDDWAGTFKVGTDEVVTFSPSLGNASTTFRGYVSNLRVVKGVAVYLGNFTPPMEPVKAVGGTSLLLNFDNAGVYDSSGSKNVSLSSNTKLSNAVSKYGASSFYLDSSSWVRPNPVSDFAFGTGDFTIEMWVYVASQTSGITQVLYDNRSSTSDNSGSGTVVWYVANGAMYYFRAGADRMAGGTVTTGAWHHFAVSRSSGSTRMFINGNQVGGTFTDSGSISANVPSIGSGVEGTLPCYYEDFRITKSARYTSNFTVPAASFPTQ